MVFIQRGGFERVEQEFAAYPLTPRAGNSSPPMIEIDDPDRCERILGAPGGFEESAFMGISAERVKGTPEADLDRTTAEGKASSVQFVHFAFTPARIAYNSFALRFRR